LAQGVSATIGGANASVVRATTIPFEVAGIIEVVLIVPDDAPSGQAPLYITVGGSPQSQDGVSVWIQ
jgi:uncharacterized protein (TIGR03437 family)